MLPMRASVARGHRCFSIGPLGLATSLSNGVGLAKEAASISAVLAGRAVQAVSGVKPEDVALNVMQRLDPETVKHMVSNAPCPMNAAAEKLAPLAGVFQKQPKRRRRRPRRRDDDHDVAALREEVAQLQKAQAELIELLRQQAEAQAQAQAQEIQAHSQQVSAAPSRTPPTPEECPATPPPTPSPEMPAAAPAPRPTLAASKVPKTSLSRAVNFTTLFARLAVDAGKRRVLGKPKSDPSPGVLSTKGLDLLVDRLCHMRGAALKLGQLLSIQDEGLVPKHVLEAFKRVRDRTNAMPAYQLNDIMSTELGPGWQDKFAEFDSDPVAAASLGQVHRARLHDGTAVAVKVQFSGVADSIASDVTNLRWVFSFGILPKGLYVENILRELQRELTRECDYEGEAHRQERYKARLESDPARHQGLRLVDVPDVHRSVSTQRVLTTTWVDGASADCLFAEGLPLAMRNEVGEAFLRLTLKELFEWRMMQTDPSFANFMYAHAERKLYLIDFGAAREYPKEFVERYFLIVYGSVVKDRQMVIDNSIKLGLLTGEECEEMLDAHVAAAEIASTPFSHRGAEDFAKFDISARMAPHVQTMLRLRLCAPPLEVYSLHRRLNGCFQWMAKLGSQVDCRRVFVDTMQQAVPHFSEDVRKQPQPGAQGEDSRRGPPRLDTMANRQQLYDQYMRGDDLGIDVDLFASSSSPPPPVARPPSAPKPPLPPSARGGAQQPPHRPPMPAMPTPSSTPAPPPFTMPQYDDPVLAVPPPPPPSHPAAGQSPPPPAAVASHSHPHAHAHAHPPPTPQEGLLNSSPLAVASPAPPQGVAHGEVTALRQQLAAEVQKVQNQNRMLRAQEEELVAAEAAAEALRSENAALRRDVAALQQQSHNAPAELAALKAEHETLRQNFEEAGLLTEQAGDLLKKVQGDVDDAAHAALTVLKRLFPDEQGPPAYEAVSELITYLGAQVEGLLGETLDTAAGLDAELNKAKAQVHGLAGEVDAARGSRTAVTSLGKELANLRAENDELRQNTASRDGAAAGRVRELEEQLRNAERLHSEHEREKQTVVELLQATESALRSLEGDYRKLKETAAAPSSEPLSVRHGMLWKYGIGSSGGASSWKERFFAADATCLQYYLSEDDYRRNDPSLMKGKRYYAAQQSFVHRFVSHASHLASCPVVGTTSIHPVATDPDAFYFGFVPKSDNELSTQAFVLRTSSKEAWQEWCQVLSHAFNGAHAPPVSAGTPDGAGAASPELLTALTPPTRSERRIMESEAFQGTRNDLGKELRKTEGALRALVEEQQPLKQRLLELEAEAEGLTKELDRATRDLQVQGMKIEVYRREAGRAAEELAELKVTNRTLSEAMGASGEEILVLRREIDDVRTRESRSLTAAAAHRQQLQAQMPPVVACAGAQTDLAGIETALEDDRRGDLSASMLSGAKAPRVAHSSAPGRRSAEDQCKELEDKLCAMTDEQHQASKKLQEQEAAHDAQIAAFCEQVLQDMDAIRLQSKVEVARREEDWQKEVAIWQQLVAEKEQQIAMTAHTVATNRPRPSPLDQEEDVTLSRDDVQWKIIGGQERASNTVLCLKLSASGEITAEPDAPKTFATKIAADRRMLSQLSVLDNPPSANALSRTWRFKSLGVDASSISLTLSITPHASHPPDLLSDLPPTSRALAAPDKRTRRFPATGAAAGLRSSSASVRSSFSHSTSPYRGRGKSRGRHTRVFVP